MPKDDLLALDYKPLVFLRCHSKTDQDTADVRTQVWQVAFKPNQSSTIATCGGNKVCIIDLSCQKVKQRYSAENKETLFALMWFNREKNDLLIAGGDLGVLYFIDVASKSQISQFSLPNSSKSKIFSLTPCPSAMSSGDIHLVVADLQFKSSSRISILTSFSCTGEITRTAFCYFSTTLFAATSTGLYGWSTCIKNYDEWKNKTITFNLQTNADIYEAEDRIIDSIEILNDGFVAGKYALDSFIYIWHVQYSIGGVQATSRTIDIIPFYRLAWCKTDNYYMEISANCNLGLLTCGDANGKIWLYDIRCLKTREDKDLSNTEMINPFNILNWPPVEDIHHAKSKKLSLETDDIVIGKAVVSLDGKYCVAITDRNTVCLWSQTKSKFHIDCSSAITNIECPLNRHVPSSP